MAIQTTVQVSPNLLQSMPGTQCEREGQRGERVRQEQARGEGETALLQTGLLMVPGTSREKRNFLSKPFTVFRESFS